MQDGSGAANSARESPDADADGAAVAAEKPSAPEPAGVGTDKTLEGVVQVRASQCTCQPWRTGPLSTLSRRAANLLHIVVCRCLLASGCNKACIMLCRW